MNIHDIFKDQDWQIVDTGGSCTAYEKIYEDYDEADFFFKVWITDLDGINLPDTDEVLIGFYNASNCEYISSDKYRLDLSKDIIEQIHWGGEQDMRTFKITHQILNGDTNIIIVSSEHDLIHEYSDEELIDMFDLYFNEGDTFDIIEITGRR